MKVQLLPSNLSNPAHLQPLTTFLIDDFIAIDGGSLGFALDVQRQRQIRHVIVTHSHSDHIASLPVFIAEAFPFLEEPVYVYSTIEVIASLRQHVFNDKIWPDFHQIRLLNGSGSGLVYFEIRHLVPFEIEHLRITPVWMNHTVPTVGLAVEDRDSAVVFTSDTYHTEEIWRLANSLPNLRAIFVDVSYPNEMDALAADSKHLTPSGLDEELTKLHRSVPVYAIHLKPQFRNQVVKQIESLRRPNVSVGVIGREYEFSSDARHRTSP